MRSLNIFLLGTVLFCTDFSKSVRSNGRFYKGQWFRHESSSNDAFQFGNRQIFWFNQTLDHFDPSNTATWSQRYFINDTFYKDGGPVFLMIGGEGEDNPLWMKEGAWIHYAQELNALCFSLEHRFYGKSQPTLDLSITNLSYLTSTQALADIAQFIQGMKITHNLTDNKWVAFGGSYPGSLSAWIRLKYPHLIHAAVSTSAPLIAKLNFKEYLGVVRDSIQQTDARCVEKIQEATKAMSMLLKRRTGWWMLQKKFKLCAPLRGDNSKDVTNLFESMAGNFMDIVQYNEDNRAFEGSPTSNITIQTLCNIMTKEDSSDERTPLERYAQVNELMMKIYGKNCTDIDYPKMIKEMKEFNWNSSVAFGERQWTYQTCNEFGFFQTSDLDDQPFGKEFGIDYSIRQCADIFGKKYTKKFIQSRIDWTNTNYGRKMLKVSRVIFVNGSIDPWHALGLIHRNETNDPSNDVIFINGTAHCANMYPNAPSDLTQLRQARMKILMFLKNALLEK